MAYLIDEGDMGMNIQIFGTNKCFDTKKAMRYFKERDIKYLLIDTMRKKVVVKIINYERWLQNAKFYKSRRNYTSIF